MKYDDIKIGDYVEEELLGELLTFDEIAEMTGELIVLDNSTKSRAWYKIVKVEKIACNKDENQRRLVFFDGKKQRGMINEIYFDSNYRNPQKAWRLKFNDKDTEKSYFDIFKEHFPKVEFEVLKGDYCPNEFFDSAPDSFGCDEECEMCWRSIANGDEAFSAKGMVIPDRWKDEPQEQEEPEQTDEEFEKDKAELEQALSEVNEKKITCPYWRKGKSLENKEFGAVDFECEKHRESFFKGGKLTQFLATHCYCHEWCNYCNQPEQASPDIVETETALPDTITEDKQITAVFDYSSLENATAAALRDCETVIRKETAGYFTLIGAKFKEAQELLADHSNGTFEQWYTALGFKRQTVYNLIQRYEFLSSPTIGGREEAFEALPVTLSYEISKPAAPPELVEKVLDGDITSNAEYKKLKAELDEANRKAEFWINANSETHKENQQLRADRVTAMNRADNAERELSKAKGRIEELESRPVEVAVQTDTAALEEKDRIISELEERISRSDGELYDLREENEHLIDSLKTQEKTERKAFIIRLTYDEFDKLTKLAKGSTLEEHIAKMQVIRI